jgi:hypothetical protein
MKAEENIIADQYNSVKLIMNERSRRCWAASIAQILGYGGVSAVARATGMSPNTVKRGIEELNDSVEKADSNRVRIPGGGRKSAAETQPGFIETLESLIDPLTRGDPESPLRWTSKSTRILALELQNYGYQSSNWLIYHSLYDLGYSLKGNKKVLEGNQHPLRNEQFEFINSTVTEQINQGNPVISVDTKKKEVLGNFSNNGQEWEAYGTSVEVNSHDFPSPNLDRANPYGIYDLNNNQGFVNVGTTHDTPSFAVASIREWWHKLGFKEYEYSDSLLITADAGGSNSYRARMWKWELQLLSNDIGIPISVCHFPPGTSKWNRVEHRLFSFISRNWRAKPLTDYETLVSLIRATKTKTGLSVKCTLDKKDYPLGKKINNDLFNNINIDRNKFQGEWNYTINPQKLN